MPTLPTVKLRPPLLSEMDSRVGGVLVERVDFCRSTSVLFLALRSEFELFLLPEDCSGADLFRP